MLKLQSIPASIPEKTSTTTIVATVSLRSSSCLGQVMCLSSFTLSEK